MSNSNSLAHDLFQMAKAAELLPSVQEELENAKRTIDMQGITIANREASILTLKAEIESLNKRNHELEVQRDDAELRFLELDEKANKVHALLSTVEGMVKDATTGLEAQKPVVSVQSDPTVPAPVETIPSQNAGSATAPALAVPTPEQASSEAPGQSAPHPIEGPMASSSGEAPEGNSAGSSEGQGVVDPTTAPTPVSFSDLAADPTAATVAKPSTEAVGYDNEPDRAVWSEAWRSWAAAMDARYGSGYWPKRPEPKGSF